MADYEPPQNDSVDFSLESYNQPSNDSVDFSLDETEGGQGGPFQLDSDPLSFPLGLDLPVQPLNLRDMNTGLAVFLVGIIASTGGASWLLRNYGSMALLGLAVVSLIMSGTLGIGLESFWALIILTWLVIIVGAIWRVKGS